jgi:tetratricopeptide (TPR) repeat protein
MDFQQLRLRVFAAMAVASMAWSGDSLAQMIRTAPDIETPRNYQPGTGVDRNGIKAMPSRRRTAHYTVPGGGYYYGWYPDRYVFYDDYYYYGGNYLCPYCGGRWCNGRCRSWGPIYYPPVAGDAGAIFGPRAVREFLGVDNNNAGGGGNLNPIIQAAAQAPAAPPKLSNPTARARAWKFVDYGDRQFKRGDYRQAVERYRKAQAQAPDVADIYFRLGFAEMGSGKYAEAVSAIRDGLQLKPDWPNSGFVLEELYPTAETKREVFRQLHAYLDQNPNDADAQYLLAVLQYFDGQSEAAEVRFRRVVELTGVDTHARAFLPNE